ncbi:MAG: hypothetical protein Kow0040_04610 [Thermogutta sp.]
MHEELGRLAAALCDGEWTAQDSLRLDELTRDPEGLAFLTRYLFLVGELHWSSLETPSPATCLPGTTARLGTGRHPLSQSDQPTRDSRTVRHILGVVTALAAIILLGFLWWVAPRRTASYESGVAQLLGSFSAGQSSGTASAASDWTCGEIKRLDRGVAAWSLPNGNSWILEGPAAAALTSINSLRLDQGRAVFQITSPGEGFCVETPFGRFIDRGTSFAVAVDERGAELHVLEGEVEFRPNDDGKTPAERDTGPQTAARRISRDLVDPGKVLYAGQAVRLDGRGRWRPIAFAAGRFIWQLPRSGSSSALQFAALRAEQVLRVFSFESSDGRYRERITGEPLLRTVLKGGGDTNALGIESGWGIGSEAVRIRRGVGNAVGAALQTEDIFNPPGLLSLEAVFRYDGFDLRDGDDAVGSLLATRGDRNRASFFLAAAHDGTLMHLFDAREDWLITEGRLKPGHWYYVAATFAECNGRIVVNTWLADLNLGQKRLRQVLRRGQAVGGMASGVLAIGKGFDAGGAHAYAFPGAVDEIVLYNGIVEENVFQGHLKLLAGDASAVPPLPGVAAEVTTGKR